MYDEKDYRKAALATFLQKYVYGLTPQNQPVFGDEVDVSKRRSYTDIQEGSSEFHCINPDSGAEYLVLEEPEVDGAMYRSIVGSIGHFNPDFIADHCGKSIDATTIYCLQNSGIEEEALHALVRSLVSLGQGLKKFVQNAEEIDGRGHYLAPYGGQETIVQIPGVYPIRNYHIYRNF